MSSRGPRLPSPTLADFGKGRLDRFRRAAAVLEQFVDGAWVPVARFGQVREANIALDNAVAGGVHPDHLRVIEVGPSRGYRLAVLLGYVVIAALVAWLIYILVSLAS